MKRPTITGIKLLVTFGLTLAGLLTLGSHVLPEANADRNPTAQDEQPFDQKKAIEEIRKKIAGQENKPATEVFKSIQIFSQAPAGRVLSVMEMGFSRSLGVDCTHCHVPGQWESEEKPTKQIARDMMQMSMTISNELLKNIKNIKSERPVVNCTTCHRGQVKPALDLPQKSPEP